MNANDLNIIFRVDDRQAVEKERVIRQTLRNLIEQDKQYAAYEKSVKQELVAAEKQKADRVKQINKQEETDRKQVIESVKRSLKQQQDDYVAAEKLKAEKIKQINKQEADEKRRLAKQQAADNKMIHDSQQRMYERMFGGQDKQTSGGLTAGITAGITVAIGLAMMGIDKLISKFRELFNVAKEGADFGVMKDNFEELSGGSEKAKNNLELLRSAVAGNLKDRELMETANKYKFLGLSIEDTARLMDGLETRGDAVKVSFEEGQKAFDSFVMTGRKQGLRTLAINAAEVEKRITELVSATGKSIDELSDEEIQSLRVKAVFEELGVAGKNVSDILNKPLDNADKLASIETGWSNIKDSISLAFSQQVVSNIDKQNDSLKDTSFQLKDNETVINKVFAAYKVWSDYIDSHSPVRLLLNIGLKFNEVFNDIGKVLDKGASNIDNFFNALKQNPNTSWVAPIIDGLKSIYDWAVDAYNKIFDIKNTVPNADFSTGTKSLDDRVRDAINSKEKQGLFKFKINAKSGTSTYEGESTSGRSGKSGTTEKEQLDRIQQVMEEIKKLESERAAYLQKYPEYLGLQDEYLEKITEKQYELKQLQGGRPQQVSGLKSLESMSEGEPGLRDSALITLQGIEEFERNQTLEKLRTSADNLKNALMPMTEAFGSFFGMLASGDTAGEAFKSLLKKLANQLIDFLEAQYLASVASSFFKAIFSAGITLTTDLAWQFLGLSALEAARGLIGALETGGPVNKSGMYLVGESGPEIRYLNSGGGVLNNRDSMDLLNNINRDKRAAGQAIEVHNHYHNLIDGMTFKTNTDIKIDKKRLNNV